MSDINMERVSALWCESREEAEKELEAGVIRMKALDGAYAAMQKEPFAVGDGFSGLPSERFWRMILMSGEIHLAKDEAGWIAMHLITNIVHGMWALWEVFTPQRRRLDPKSLTAAELVLTYCFAPEGLGLKKVKAYAHPENLEMLRYLKHLGFTRRATLPDEALFNGESHTMILWELANPMLNVNQLEPEPISEEVSDGWESTSGIDGNGSVEPELGTGSDSYEPVPDPWDVLVRITDSQRSMASAANSVPANARSGAGGRAASPTAKNYWQS